MLSSRRWLIRKQEITDADIRALVAGTMVENPEGFHFDDLQLQTHADNDIEALVSLANMDGEKSRVQCDRTRLC